MKMTRIMYGIFAILGIAFVGGKLSSWKPWAGVIFIILVILISIIYDQEKHPIHKGDD